MIKRLRETVRRPWGEFRNLAVAPGAWHLKIIEIKKGARLSLQIHQKRSEFLVVARGKLLVQKGKTNHRLNPGQSLLIKKSEAHRLAALSTVTVVELAFGRFRENDIVRLADDYGRAKK